MRISDGSSDVCSSDLRPLARQRSTRRSANDRAFGDRRIDHALRPELCVKPAGGAPDAADRFLPAGGARTADHVLAKHDDARIAFHLGMKRMVDRFADIHHCHGRRSEEHTSELQSLMRISYAVFCLKKKKN